MRKYLLNILIAFDQLVNAIIGGSPDETLSASAWIGEQQGKVLPRFFRPVIDRIFLILGDRDHCHGSYLSELNRSQLPDAYAPKAHLEPERGAKTVRS